MAEALGMSLPGCAAIPAVDSRRRVIAQLTGRRIVEMVKEDLRISKILKRENFLNAVRANGAAVDTLGRAEDEPGIVMRAGATIIWALVFTVAGVHAQSWPAKPLRWISPFAPGGGADFTSRALAQKIAPALGQQIIVITWLHQAQRDVLKVHPRDDLNLPLTGVFATRSSDRPNPLGLHRVRLLEIAGSRLRVGPLEAIDGTPIVDIKPVLAESADW